MTKRHPIVDAATDEIAETAVGKQVVRAETNAWRRRRKSASLSPQTKLWWGVGLIKDRGLREDFFVPPGKGPELQGSRSNEALHGQCPIDGDVAVGIFRSVVSAQQ